jgi:hypothetical protein
MNDIVTRLRNWRDVHLARLHLLMEEAADEMERLSANGDCPAQDNPANRDNTPAANATPTEGSVRIGCTLTDLEREAVKECYEWAMVADHRSLAATLRLMLERLGGGK